MCLLDAMIRAVSFSRGGELKSPARVPSKANATRASKWEFFCADGDPSEPDAAFASDVRRSLRVIGARPCVDSATVVATFL